MRRISYAQYSLKIDDETETVTHNFATNQEGIAKMWFYDDASDTSLQAMANADNTTSNRSMGVVTVVSTDKYVYRVDSVVTATNISRTTGWHELKFDYTSGTKCDMYIDA